MKKEVMIRNVTEDTRGDKNTICLPRQQGIPFCLRPLNLLDFRRFRAESWDTFGTVDGRDIAY